MGTVVFTDVEHLIGADDNEDEFVFSAEGKTSGHVEGGAGGYDTVVLDGGTFKSVVFSAVNSSDGTISRDNDKLTYNGMEPLIDETVAVVRVFEASDDADEIKVWRPSAGKIKIESVNAGGPTFENVEFFDPTGSLTIVTKGDHPRINEIVPGALSGADTVTFESLGVFAADLIVETGSLSAMLDDRDTITFKGDVDLQGHKLEATAETITLDSGVTVSTSLVGGAAGNITLNSWHTTISTNAKLLAEGTTSGDITINAIDENAVFTPVVNLDALFLSNEVGVTVMSGASVKGRDVTITAIADNRHIFDSDNFAPFESAKGAKVANGVLQFLEGLSQVVVGISAAQSSAKVEIATGATITATGDFEAHAAAFAKASAAPMFNDVVGKKIDFPLPAVTLGFAVTDAMVTIGGEVNAGGNATIASRVDHIVDVVSSAKAVHGIAPAAALSIINSNATSHVTDDATLTVGGNLLVEAHTVDRNRTLARSTAGQDGKVGVSTAVTVEYGETNAYLDGTSTVTGAVIVSASQLTEDIDAKALFVVPTFAGGTSAIAGAGTDSTGDALDDAKAQLITDGKAGAAKVGSWFRTQASNVWSQITGKFFTPVPEEPVTKNNVRTWDAAAAVAVVVDTNVTRARIGDGGIEDDGAAADGEYGDVSAGGTVQVLSSVRSRPDITAFSRAIAAGAFPPVGPEPAGSEFGGSLAVAVGVYTNEAFAHLSEQARVDAGEQFTVKADALNEIDPLSLWGVNLVTPFLTRADHQSTETAEVSNGEIVRVDSGHTSGGDSGSWYKYIGGAPLTLTLSDEDFTNENRWEDLGNPVTHVILGEFVPTVTTYLNNNLGLDANLVDTWSQATAGGQKLALAGAVTVLDLDQKAEALIKAGAKINQPLGDDPLTTNGKQAVVVGATSVSHLVNFGGNIKLPGLEGSKGHYKPHWESPGLGTKSAADGDAVGATVMVFNLDNTVTAKIEDGVTLAADSLHMTADNYVLSVSVSASGGHADDFGLNGAFAVTSLENTTIAQIENGATIAVGTARVADSAGTGAFVFLDALDQTRLISLVGGVATSEHIGVGLSTGFHDVRRNTEAVIGNHHLESPGDARGMFTALGGVRLTARNEGFIGAVVVAGSSVSQKSNDPAATSGSTGLRNGNGTTTDNPGALSNSQPSTDSTIADVKQNKLGGTPDAASDSVGTQQGKAGIGVSGAAAVTWIDDNARAYIHETGAVTASGSALLLSAANDTGIGSLSGGIAFAGDRKSETDQTGIAGAVGFNWVSGATQAFIDDAQSVSAKSLRIEADRGGSIVSITAGVSGAQGRAGVAVGGSVSLTWTEYTAGARLANTTATIDGAVTLDAVDDTNIVLVAGSAGFGGKVGVGSSIAFAEIANITRATIDSITSLKHAGDLSVTASADGDIIAVTGSAGVGTGETSKAGVAGTLTSNRIANIVEAEILNTTFHNESTGNITIGATDNSFVFAFAGAFGRGKTAGLGVAAAVNLLDNALRARVEGSTIRSTGDFTLEAEQKGGLAAVAVGVASSQQWAGAGSIAISGTVNTVEAHVSTGSDVKVDGAVVVSAVDRAVNVNVSGEGAKGKTTVVGAAFSLNVIGNTVTAAVDDALVESTGSTAAVEAEARAVLVTVAIGGAVGDKFALGGSVAINHIGNTVEASVTDANGSSEGKATHVASKGDLVVAAADHSTLVAVAGGLAFASSTAVGVAASTTDVQNKVHAFVDRAKVTSKDGAVSLTAGFKPPETEPDLEPLEAIALGTDSVALPEAADSQIVSVAFGGGGSSSFVAGGAFSVNWIRNDVQAYAVNTATVQAAKDVTIAAHDQADIYSFAVGGVGSSTSGAGIGVSYNYVGGDPGHPSLDIPDDPASDNVGKAMATVKASTVTSVGGSVAVLASQQPKILNVTVGGAVAGTKAGGGAISLNFIRGIVDAAVVEGSTVSAKQDIIVTANAVPKMITVAGNVNLSSTAGFGIASATSNMQSQITARIDGSTAKATEGDILVDASIGAPEALPVLSTDLPVDAQIWTFAVAGSGAGTVAIAGSLSLNWIRNVVEARISNVGNLDPEGDEISAGGTIAVTASDASTLNAVAGAISAALSQGSGAAGASVAYNYLGGNPGDPFTTENNRVRAVIENVTGTLKANDIEVKADYTGHVTNITIGGAGAQNFSLGGSVSINKIRNTADAHISGSTDISTAGGGITVEAKDQSQIRALAGGVGISVAVGGGVAGAVGISVGHNLIENTTTAYIDASKVTSKTGVSLKADSTQTIRVLTIGGAFGGTAGDGAALAGAGAGSGNTVRNHVLAYVVNSEGTNEVKADGGKIELTAEDVSEVLAASGGVAGLLAFGGAGSIAASVGISASVNEIDNEVKAYIDKSVVTAAGAGVELKATEGATIKAYALGGSLQGAGGGAAGGGAFGGAGAGASNTIGNTVQAYIGGSSFVTTTGSGAVKLTASDTSTIHIDSGGVAISLSGGAGGGASVSIGASVAANHIENTIQAYVDGSTVNAAGAVEIMATSLPTIDAFSFAGAVAGAGGAGGGVAVTGSGAWSTNTIKNTVEAYAKGASITTLNGGAVKFHATEGTEESKAKITSHAIGGAVSIAGGAGGGASISIGASIATNDVASQVRAYSDTSTITSSGALELRAASTTEADSASLAVSIAAQISLGSFTFAGGGAWSTTRVHNTVEAYAVGKSVDERSTITAADGVTIAASETSTLSAGVGSGAVAVGVAGASVGISSASNTADSIVNAYANNVNLTSIGGSIAISATAEDTISKTLGAATSIAISIGAGIAGASATATVAPTIDAYAGTGATLAAAEDVTITAGSTGSADANTFGLSVGAVALGGSLTTASADGSILAHLDGTIASSRSVSIDAQATHTATANATALGGGIGIAAVVGAGGYATVSPTVRATAPGVITANDGVSVTATATPAATASALGAAVVPGSGSILAVGVSNATALSSPTIEAKAGGAASTITSNSLSVTSALVVLDDAYTAKSEATGSAGGALIGVDATSSRATTSGSVWSSVGDGTTLGVRESVSITATGDSKQQADADSHNLSLIAAGGNSATATADIDTRAFMGAEVTLSNGTDIGGLTEGDLYYVVLDDTRPFSGGHVNAVDDTIDLGTDHGVVTDDRVIFREGESAIAGLDSLQTYAVEMVEGTNRVRLRHINEDGSPGGLVDIGSTASGSFSLVDPRRVRLSPTFEGAHAAAPTIVDLDASTASGSTHTLTPLTGFAATSVEFDPTTGTNSSTNAIELPSGHGLRTGQAVAYARSGGADVTIEATGHDYMHAVSEGGSGGVIAGAAARSYTVGDSETHAYVADDSDDDATRTLLRVSTLSISASHTAQFDGDVSTLHVSLFGGSGAAGSNEIATTVEARIGEAADIQSQDLEVTAVNTTRKDIVTGNNVRGGSGGAVQGTNAESITNIENRTSATIGDHATVKVTGNVGAPGNFVLSAFNDHEGDDEVLLDTGGLFVGSGVQSHIKVNVNEATAAIGKNAKIETVGALDLETHTRAKLSTHPTAHTYGIAGYAGVDSEVLVHATNAVSIGDGTTVQALGDINLLAGRTRDGVGNDLELTSHGDNLSVTLVPISSLRSHVDIVETHTVNVGSGAVLRGARDANLIADTVSVPEIVSYVSGKSLLTAIGSGIDWLLGGDASAEEKGGTVENTRTAGVTVNGTVEVGILKDQTLTIGKGDGTSEATLIEITENVGSIGVTTSIESVGNNLVAERQRLQALLAEYAGDIESVNAYTAAIEEIERQMTELGLSTTVGGDTFYAEDFSVPYVTVAPIRAQSGTIRLSGDTVSGTGALQAPGDVNVTITNNSPAYLRLLGITIPDHAGGRVLWNGKAAADVTSIDGFDFAGAIIASTDTTAPRITIVSTFNADHPDNHADPWKLFRTPDIEIAGDIENVSGKVTLTSEGSVVSRANIVAGTLEISAGKDFVLTAPESLFHVGGSPASTNGPWKDVQAAAESFGTSKGKATTTSVTGATVTGGAISNVASLVAAALKSGNTSNIVAANNVIIVAQTLNVNGILQSGIADYNVNITESYASKLAAAENARSLYLSGQVGLAESAADAAGIQPDEGFTYFRLTGPALVTDASGLEYSSTTGGDNIPVFYNAANDRLEVSGVRVQGGFMSLTGRILNTNPSAEIRVMDGYGRIAINNDLGVPLMVNRLDTSAGIEGKLKIADSGNRNAEGAPLVTQYTRVGADVQKRQYYFVAPGEDPTIIHEDQVNNTRQWDYAPQSTGYRFNWTTGNDLTKRTITTYGTSTWLGIDALAADPANIVNGPKITYANPRALLTGSYIEESSSADYTYEFERNTTTEEQRQILRKWSTSTWYGKTTYYAQELKWSGSQDIHTHSVRADRPIAITFIGYDAGGAAATVASKGDILINGEVQNAQGTTILTAGGGLSLVNDSVSVGGHDITLVAGSSIGADAPIRTNLTNGGGGSLSAAASSVVRIEEVSGDLTVNQVGVLPSGDRVELKAAGSILGNAANLVRGGLVVLDAGGAVGWLGAGTARQPGLGAMAINVDTGVTDRDTLTVRARGDVYVRETAGHLRLVSIDTTDAASGLPSGNVRVEVMAGRLIDANTIEVKDPRTELQLMAVWERMNATESTAPISVESTVRALELQRTREYQSYWNYRSSQPDGGDAFDPTYEIALSEPERAAYADYFASQGLAGQEIEDAITTLENARTQEYRELHKTYGKLGDLFDSAYRYATSVTQLFGSAAIDAGTDTIALKGHAFDTGDGVVYHSGDGAIEGLLDGQTYYVVVDADKPGTFRLAHTRADATAATPSVVALGAAVTGDAHLFSAADLTFTQAAVDAAAHSIELPKHTFQTGQAVVYHSRNGSITGLTEDETYYVVVTGDDPGRIRLAATHDEATAATPMVLEISVAADGRFLLSEADVMAQGAAWSETQLKNSFSSKILQPKGTSGTTATREAANIIGRDIAMQASSDVGSVEAQIDIVLPITDALTDAQRLALTAAERSDVTFFADTAGTIEIDDPRATSETVSLIRIVPKADVDVTASGAVTVTGATVNLGSEEAISIDTVISAQSARITGQKSLTSANLSAVNVASGHLILEAEDEGIGSSSHALVIDLHPGATLIARAKNDIYIHEVAGDLSVLEVTSTDGHVDLRADRSIVDADDDDLRPSGPDWNILAESVALEAGTNPANMFGSIGSTASYLEIELASGGMVRAIGDAGVYLHEVTGDMNVDLVKANAGDVGLRAAASILDFKNDVVPDVVGNNITLRADFGGLGAPLNDLDLDSASQAAGSVTAHSAGNAHLTEPVGNLSLNTVRVDAGTAFIKALVGSILDGNPDPASYNVLSGKVFLFASKDIGQSSAPITSKVANLEAESTTGATYITNSGSLVVGGVTSASDSMKAGGDMVLGATSPITVIGNQFAVGQIVVVATDDGNDGDPDGLLTPATKSDDADVLIVKSGVTVRSDTSSVRLLAGDDLTIDAGATVQAATFLTIQGGFQGDAFGNPAVPGVNVDNKGTTIALNGHLSAPLVKVWGSDLGDTIVLHPQSLVGHTQVFGQGGTDLIVVDRLPSVTTTRNRVGEDEDGLAFAVRDTLDVDGGAATDTYVVNISGGAADYVITINDTGAAGDADTLTINGTSENDLFLVREHFVAYLVPQAPLAAATPPGTVRQEVERINYNGTIDGRLTVNALGGDDHFYVDDNSTLTTLDGGAGEDFFQFGQIFGTDRTPPAVAPGDEIETVFTTVGWVSRGVSQETLALGGTGNDTFQVYSNQAEVRLEGNEDDDTFTVQSFTPAGALDVDGGTGSDQFNLLGSEFSDTFVVAADGVLGAGQQNLIANLEMIAVDGFGGNDHFFVHGTPAGVTVALTGGLGSDTFDVGGDPISHLARSVIQGPLVIDGGIGEGDRRLRRAVILPTETDSGLLNPATPADDTGSIDTVNIFNDGSIANDTATLTGTNVRIDGMADGGITYGNVETLEILFGRGDDTLTIEDTMLAPDGTRGPLTIVHGGGGSDHITVNGGGGQASPLIVFGDTSQDGARYDGTPGVVSANAFRFDNPGGDTIDARGADGSVAIYGGRGNDTIWGSEAGDQIAGGSGNDVIHAVGGDDLVYGDSGFNLATDGRRLLTIAALDLSASPWADTLVAGGDVIAAGDGNNVVIGDLGLVTQSIIDNLFDTSGVVTVQTTQPADGGDDSITTLGGRDLILGGAGGDTVAAGEGHDTVLGDLGRVVYQAGIAVRIDTTDTSIGGADTVRAAGGDDIVIGGRADDSLDGGAGRDLIVGDSVTLTRTATLGDVTNPRFRALSGTQIYSVDPATAGTLLIDTSTDYADPRGAAWWADFQITLLHHAADTAATFDGADYIAGGAGDDTIFGQLGHDVIQGDGSIDFVSNGGRVGAFRDATNVLHLNPSFDDATDGHDYIEGGGGGDVIVGNGGQDDIIGGSSVLFSLVAPSQRPDGADIIFGGSGTKAGRHDAGDGTAQGHASDADAIVGDNGNIFRLVGVNGAPGGGGGVGTFGGFLAFNYDNYTNSLPVGQQVKIVARGISLLDYTPGGPDYVGQAGPLVVGNIGAADEIHGEAGDDVVYAGAGSDVLFGDGQDDDLMGGYGLDWISGGTGDDGILGDDGRIFTSRNGTAEPLNGIAATVQSTITNSNGQIAATIHVTGTLAKRVDLTPFFLDPNSASQDPLFRPVHADDIIYGGLGRDFMHGGSGDDAMSGAEALGESYLVVGSTLVRSDFLHPFNPGNALRYDAASTKFAYYDAADPMRRIRLNTNGTLASNGVGAEFFLNFDPAEGPLAAGSTTAHTDGDDVIFGDLGNDWMVGGTGRDHVYAGWGDDLVNADDDHSTAGGLNNAPDAQASYGDIVFGGAGRDVLIANTSGDAMIDSSEFDSFVVPFSKFGPPTVNRAINPALEQFLYSLSAADGADQTLSAPGVPGGGTATRNGEPFGELGLVRPQDAAWGDQHGGPRDPQSGNTSGSSADALTGGGKKPQNAVSLAAPTTSTGGAPSIDWTGNPASVTVLPWAQGLQARPIGLSVPAFDLEDDDDLIDWAALVSTRAHVAPVVHAAAAVPPGQAKKR